MNITIKSITRSLSSIFEKLPIDVVYLYGSVAFGKNDKLSDYDFGILFSKEISEKKRFNIRLKLFGMIAEKLGVNEDKIDVVDLLDVPILLQFNAISGKLIYCVDENRRVEFEIYLMRFYHEEQYYLKNILTKI